MCYLFDCDISLLQLILSDVENHHRLVNELAERVANLEALSENPDVSDSLSDVQRRYDKVRNRARVSITKMIDASLKRMFIENHDQMSKEKLFR